MEASIVLSREYLAYSGAALCREMLRQTEPDRHCDVQFAMLHAAQELLLATRWKHLARPELFCARHCIEWRFESVSYLFFPKPDDRLVEIYAEATKHVQRIVLLIPSDHEWQVRRAIEAERQLHLSELFTVEDYLAWRTLWAGLDASWTRRRVVSWWLSKYNRCVRRRNFPGNLIVRLSR